MEDYKNEAITTLELVIKDLRADTSMINNVSIDDCSVAGEHKSTRSSIIVICSSGAKIKIELPVRREAWL